MRPVSRRPSIFEMLHFGLPREPQFTSNVTLWKMPVSADEEEEAEAKKKRQIASRTASTLSSLPRSRYNRYNTDSEINTIYGVTRENIASRGMSVPSLPPTPLQTQYLPQDIELCEEKEYIDRLLMQDYDNFSKMIMQNFFKAPKSRNLGYGMPRPETREDFGNGLAALSKKPGVVRVPSHTSLCKPIRCENHNGCSEEFCEILGPGCCSACIETTNRQVAEEIQRRLFPEIEVSRRCLVAPKLTQVLKEGHIKQVRRKRVQELKQSEAKKTAVTIIDDVKEAQKQDAKIKNGVPETRESMKLPPVGTHQPTFTTLSSRESHTQRL